MEWGFAQAQYLIPFFCLYGIADIVELVTFIS